MIDPIVFEIKARLEKFSSKGGWHFVRVPKDQSDYAKRYAVRGFIPIKVTINNFSWNTMLLPMGDGSRFIVIKKKVRDEFNLETKDKLKISYKLRD